MALRERILVYGGPGTGKSRGWLSIAARFKSSRVFVLDTDDAAERMVAGKDLPNVSIMPCLDWTDYMLAAKQAQKKLGPDDWLVVDMMSAAWDAAQGYYIEEAFGMSKAEFLMKERASKIAAGKEKTPALTAMAPEWTVINELYRQFTGVVKYRIAAHTYLTASAKVPHPEYNPQALKSIYQSLPMQPGGQKDLSHEVHTVLFLEHPKPKEWVYTVVKDRERGDDLEAEQTVRVGLTDFSFQYVMRMCGHRANGNGG